MAIERREYVNLLMQKRWNGKVKIVTGIRRCGKSFLLNTLFKQRLLEEGTPEDSFVELALDRKTDLQFRNPSVYWRRENHEKDERCRVLCRDVAPEARLLHGNLQTHHPQSELPAGARDYPSLLPDAGRNHSQESTLLFMDA